MKVYSFDNVLITNAKVPDDFVYKLLDAMAKNKDDLSPSPAIASSRRHGRKQFGVLHPGALKFFKERNLTPRPIE